MLKLKLNHCLFTALSILKLNILIGRTQKAFESNDADSIYDLAYHVPIQHRASFLEAP